VRDDCALTGHFGLVGIHEWLAFTAPELQSSFMYSSQVDLWSLGAVLYTMLCGVPPFRGDGDKLMDNKEKVCSIVYA
jgi:serine/threonine protein kinase